MRATLACYDPFPRGLMFHPHGLRQFACRQETGTLLAIKRSHPGIGPRALKACPPTSSCPSAKTQVTYATRTGTEGVFIIGLTLGAKTTAAHVTLCITRTIIGITAIWSKLRYAGGAGPIPRAPPTRNYDPVVAVEALLARQRIRRIIGPARRAVKIIFVLAA